jgi:hypothetical protein
LQAGVLGLVVLVVAIVLSREYARRAGVAFGAVMQNIGELGPFTQPAPAGSVVILDSDTVAVIEQIVGLGDSVQPQTLYRGRWLEHTPTSTRSDTLLEGFDRHGRQPTGPVVIDLVRRTTSREQSVGALLLEPGAHRLTVRRGS